MNNKRLLFLGMVALTLGIGVIIGSVVSGGVKATFEQKAAAIALPDPVSLSNTFSQIAEKLDPAVVKIRVEIAPARSARSRQGGGGGGGRVQPVPIPGFPGGLPFDFGQPEDRGGTGTGTGFIVDKAGFIMTNNHVVERASKITVFLTDGSQHDANVIGTDEATDLAVVKVNVGHDLSTAKFGNSDAVKVGDWVLAIGSPFGFDHTVTSGIISAKGRDNSELGVEDNFKGLQKFLQTDAAINPGNSGGPLVNMAGEVIGVNTAIVSETNSFAGLGFALPSNTALNVYNQLSSKGKVTRGSIGISYHSSKDQDELSSYGLKVQEAVIVDQVYTASPAEKAGLQPHDVITEIDGKKILSGNQLQDYIVDRPVGTNVRLGWLRDGKPMSAALTIGDRVEVLAETGSSSSASNRPGGPKGGPAGTSNHLGISVEPLTAQQKRQLNLQGGVMITDVDPDSVAEDKGLAADMIVTGYMMDGQKHLIAGVAEFNTLESKLKAGTSLTLFLRIPSDNYRRDISIPMKLK
jgi:serine protease Do